jgi:predicted dehydrogenase
LGPRAFSDSMTAVRVGVMGVGALGQHHARIYAELPDARLVGVHDANAARAGEIAARHGTRAFEIAEDLVAQCDAVSVAVPTVSHCALAKVALAAGRDVLVEKPMTATLREADELIALAAKQGALLQVGHVERFNPAAQVLLREARQPLFVEVHRLGAFPGRSLDVDVVLDVMIHDLDLILTLDATDVKAVDAVGVPVLTNRADIANARLRFASGLVANVTASRVSMERMRKFRVFAQGRYVSADLATREARIHRLAAGADGRPTVIAERLTAPHEEPLRRQLEAFVSSVRSRQAPVVSGEAGRRALALARRIVERINAPTA